MQDERALHADALSETNSPSSKTGIGADEESTVDSIANWLKTMKTRPRLEIKRTTGMTRTPLPPMGSSKLAPVKTKTGDIQKVLGAAPRKRLCGALNEYRQSRLEKSTVAGRRAKKLELMEKMNAHKRKFAKGN